MNTELDHVSCPLKTLANGAATDCRNCPMPNFRAVLEATNAVVEEQYGNAPFAKNYGTLIAFLAERYDTVASHLLYLITLRLESPSVYICSTKKQK